MSGIQLQDELSSSVDSVDPVAAPALDSPDSTARSASAAEWDLHDAAFQRGDSRSTPALKESWLDSLAYWTTLPLHWGAQIFRNGSDILKVLDIMRFRPMPAGLVGLDHPWVTGISPETKQPVWFTNVIYRSAPSDDPSLASDETVLLANGRFLAQRVRQSAIVPEIQLGPGRRMPHCINYMHGSSHYNSGLIVLNEFQDVYRHINDARFRRELRRFVADEKREVLFLLRTRDYCPKQFAYMSCCMRSHFRWFCNPNGPREKVLWGNAAPFPAANLITGHWSDDVYALRKSGGAGQVVRAPIESNLYFQNGPYDQGRDYAIWPEKALAWANYYRVRIRGRKGGMFFVDRRQIYADQIQTRHSRGLPDEDRAEF